MTGAHEVYAAVDQLMASLRSAGQSKPAEILHHRLHVVAWTTSSEVLEELRAALNDTLKERGVTSTGALHDLIRSVQIKINAVLGEPS